MRNNPVPTETQTYQIFTNQNPIIISSPFPGMRVHGIILEEFDYIDEINTPNSLADTPKYLFLNGQGVRGRYNGFGQLTNCMAIIPRQHGGEYTYRNEIEDMCDTDDYLSQLQFSISDFKNNIINFSENSPYKLVITYYLSKV